MVKERPILYKGSMVRAVINDLKSKTRRVNGLDKFNEAPDEWEFDLTKEYFKMEHKKLKYAEFFVCPLGEVGDILWVKETFKLKAGNQGLFYAADYDDLSFTKWTSPLFMKKEYSRLKLKIVSVTIERLRDITEEECILEGVKYNKNNGTYSVGPNITELSAYGAFRKLWISINGIEDWNSNPWVWVIEFKKQN